MKKKVAIFLIIIYLFSMCYMQQGIADDSYEGIPCVEVYNDTPKSVIPKINAEAAIVIDVKSGRTLLEKNAYAKEEIASTTKIMTAIIALENGNPEDEVTISKRAASIGGSSIDLVQGEKLKLRDLLYGLMLNSGNDAAVAIAEYIGGSVEAFVDMMNKKAFEIGALNTSYKSPHGLDLPEHYSTAYDLALITRYALNNADFTKIVSTISIKIPGRSLYNTNEMLGLYPGADGVKTGYTGKAGRCLVTSVSRDNWKVISVVLNCATRNIRAQNSKDILDYAFKNYKPYSLLVSDKKIQSLPVIKGVKGEVAILAVNDITIPLRDDEAESLQTVIELPDELHAPIHKGIEVGMIKYLVNGKIIAQSPLKTAGDIRRKGFMDYLKNIVTQWGEIVRG